MKSHDRTNRHDRCPAVRRLIAAATAATALFSGAGAGAIEDAAAELPRRKPGLWRISTISPEIGLQKHDVCIEAGDSIVGAIGANCSKPSVRADGGETIVTFSCGLGRAREVTSLLFTGDFASWYRAQSKVTLTLADGTAQQRSGFTIDAKFLGSECPASR
jgi:hypothetical protein